VPFIDQAILFAISLAANVFSAFSGGGAGLVQLPALIFLGLPFAVALATHKVASVALGLGATVRHLRERTLRARHVAVVLAAGLPGVVAGAGTILHVPGRAAEVALGVMTAALGFYSLAHRRLGLEAEERTSSRSAWAVGAAGLFLIGILNGSLTSGTGLFVTLWLVRWFGMDYRMAVAHTLVLVGVFWNGAGAVTLGWLGEIRWDWLPALLLGSLLGGYLGAHLSIVAGNRWIKRGYELVTILIGMKLVMG
jgi:uncharacterized membrane protein YfcA